MSLLKQANHALRNGQYETAIRLYQQSLQDSPALAHIIQPNLKLAQSRHQKQGQRPDSPHCQPCRPNPASTSLLCVSKTSSAAQNKPWRGMIGTVPMNTGTAC